MNPDAPETADELAETAPAKSGIARRFRGFLPVEAREINKPDLWERLQPRNTAYRDDRG